MNGHCGDELFAFEDIVVTYCKDNNKIGLINPDKQQLCMVKEFSFIQISSVVAFQQEQSVYIEIYTELNYVYAIKIDKLSDGKFTFKHSKIAETLSPIFISKATSDGVIFTISKIEGVNKI